MVVTQEDKSIELLDVDPQETEDDGRHFRPTEQYSDIGGWDRQIQKLIEAVVLPTTHKDKFKNLRIHPPKSTYLKLAGQCAYFFNLLFGPTMNVKIRSCFNHFVISRSQLSTELLGVTIRTRFTTGCPSVPSRRPKSLPTVPSLRVSFPKPFPLVRPQMLSHAVRNATLCYTSTDRAKAPASSTEQSPPQSLFPHSPNQLDTRVDTTIGLPAHIDSAGGLNPPLASNRTIFTGTSFSLATSPSIRSTSSISLLNREPSSSSSPFTNPELPITLPSSSPNVTLFPPTMVNVSSPSHVLCFLVVILPQHTCVVVEGNKQVTVLNCHYPH
ncbi:26S protease regulatory subunit 6A-A [Culex quinquefasciatus]|uniref:26S protease regulatory subunit 6A-A n=1 Tax=Culex quinquefasciatus TaxID=7176 RepID=B0X7B7_CULQU|nr:26S protease regulatory subunit 6A-A [Culex quinquefasciatus]|eukprot:XP_001865539.1 26S protease regulatory subunit 6A-A [Culex quinquefasciatus]